MNKITVSKPALKRFAPCGCVLLMAMMLVLVPAVSWMIWSATVARRLTAEIAKIRAAGEPREVAEMSEFYSRSEEREDTPRLWLQVTDSFAQPTFAAHAKTLQIIGSGPVFPPLGEPWEQQAVVEELLKLDAGEMKTIRQAPRLGGGARFDVRFEEGFDMALTHAHKVRLVSRMLMLETHVRAHRGDHAGLFEALHALLLAPARSKENRS